MKISSSFGHYWEKKRDKKKYENLKCHGRKGDRKMMEGILKHW